MNSRSPSYSSHSSQCFSSASGKTNLKALLGATILLACIASLLFIWNKPGYKPLVIYPYAPPTIKAESMVHDLGVITSDSKVTDKFYIYNIGGKPLEISRVEATCGCTVAELSKNHLNPGEYAKLKVTMDTSIKSGKTRKKITIYSNDPKHPEYKVFLNAVVKLNMNEVGMKNHQNIVVKDPLVLFKGECATCHVDKGKGKVGKELFLADCAMCHGQNASGRKDIAPSLIQGDFHTPAFKTRLRKIITEGTPHNPQMAPFAIEKGGPLNQAEIDSLVNFLTYQAKQAKAGKLEQDLSEEDVEKEQIEAVKSQQFKLP